MFGAKNWVRGALWDNWAPYVNPWCHTSGAWWLTHCLHFVLHELGSQKLRMVRALYAMFVKVTHNVYLTRTIRTSYEQFVHSTRKHPPTRCDKPQHILLKGRCSAPNPPRSSKHALQLQWPQHLVKSGVALPHPHVLAEVRKRYLLGNAARRKTRTLGNSYFLQKISNTTGKSVRKHARMPLSWITLFISNLIWILIDFWPFFVQVRTRAHMGRKPVGKKKV